MPPTNCSKVILKCLNTCPKHFKNDMKYRKMALKCYPHLLTIICKSRKRYRNTNGMDTKLRQDAPKSSLISCHAYYENEIKMNRKCSQQISGMIPTCSHVQFKCSQNVPYMIPDCVNCIQDKLKMIAKRP